MNFSLHVFVNHGINGNRELETDQFDTLYCFNMPISIIEINLITKATGGLFLMMSECQNQYPKELS